MEGGLGIGFQMWVSISVAVLQRGADTDVGAAGKDPMPRFHERHGDAIAHLWFVSSTPHRMTSKGKGFPGGEASDPWGRM